MANPRPTPKPGNLGPQTSLTRCTFPVLYPVLAPERGPEWQTHAQRRNLGRVVRYPIAKARGFPALTFPRGEDSATLRVPGASYEAALPAPAGGPALAWPLLTKLCFGAPHGVS